MGGDSGAWIIDNSSGSVCGHVLAWSSKSSVAYLSPMEVLLADMARVLHADVALPGCQPLAAEDDDDDPAAMGGVSSATATATATAAPSIPWLALGYTEEVVGEALARPVLGTHAAGKQKATVPQLVSSLHREVKGCSARNAAASVTAYEIRG